MGAKLQMLSAMDAGRQIPNAADGVSVQEVKFVVTDCKTLDETFSATAIDRFLSIQMERWNAPPPAFMRIFQPRASKPMITVGRFGGITMSEGKLYRSSVTRAFIPFMGRFA
jgi:hypothetical protein